MIKTYTKEKVTVTENLDFIESMKCDYCKKEIASGDEYFEVITRHHDWGNDSGDSRQIHQVCSIDCLTKFVDKYYRVDEARSSTAELEITQEYFHKDQQAPYRY